MQTPSNVSEQSEQSEQEYAESINPDERIYEVKSTNSTKKERNLKSRNLGNEILLYNMSFLCWVLFRCGFLIEFKKPKKIGTVFKCVSIERITSEYSPEYYSDYYSDYYSEEATMESIIDSLNNEGTKANSYNRLVAMDNKMIGLASESGHLVDLKHKRKGMENKLHGKQQILSFDYLDCNSQVTHFTRDGIMEIGQWFFEAFIKNAETGYLYSFNDIPSFIFS